MFWSEEIKGAMRSSVKNIVSEKKGGNNLNLRSSHRKSDRKTGCLVSSRLFFLQIR